MKKNLLVVLAGLAFGGLAQAADFVNGGFDDGTLNGWTSTSGCWGGGGTCAPYTGAPLPLSPSLFTGPGNNFHMGPASLDPITGLSTVYSGTGAVRVNDTTNNYTVSTISQSVLAYGNNNIFFAWQAVLESSHGLTDSDHFSLVLRDDTTGTDVVTRAYSSAGSIGSGTTGVTWTPAANNSNWFTAGWVVENIDLLALGIVGHDFTLTLLAADCPYGGHAGYVYLDGFGAVAPPPGQVPEPGSLALLGFGLVGLAVLRRRQRQ
jgi:hypothetical protein